MDLQDDKALEIMAQSSPPSLPASVTAPPAAAGPSVPTSSVPSASRTSQQPQKGFPKQLAQNAVEEKFLCEHCNLILRQPMQSTCGHRFCRSCRDELSSQQQPIHCQACLSEGATLVESILDLASMFEDKAAIREMKKIPVKCINQGCQWKGTFQEYTEAHEFGCDKKLVECSLCGVPVSQAKITHHESKQCPKRRVTCQHCKEEMFFDQQDKHLQASCPDLPINCDRCTKKMPRSELKTHKEVDCPHRLVECPVPDCNTKLPLDQFPNHFMKTQQSTQKHMLYLFSKLDQLEKNILHLESEATGAVGGASGEAAPGAVLGRQNSEAFDRDGVASAEGGAANVLESVDRQKLKLHEDLMAVLHGEILRCIKQVEALCLRIEKEGKTIKDGQKKIENLERAVVVMEGRLPPSSSPDSQEYGNLTQFSDGTATWRIESFSQVRRGACNGQQTFIVSPSFTTGVCGYKMRIRFHADGDGSARGRAFSIFIQLQKGPHDDLLPWPFMGKVYFMIVDLKDFKQHKVVSFSALPGQPEFRKPDGDNTPSGCQEFVNLKEFSDNLDKYLVNDTVFMRVYVSLPETVNNRLQSLDPKNFINVRR